jgi:hypothetical protein
MGQEIMFTRRRVLLVIIASAVIFFLASAVMGWLYYEKEYGSEWAPTRIASSIDEGDRIVAMTLRFRRQNDRYPLSLDELVPRYLPEIRPPAAGTREWNYQSDGDHYRLTFAAQAGRPLYVYDSTVGEWREER